MGNVHYTAAADLPADEAFAFVSDAPNLSQFLPQATEEAWVQADQVTRRLSWGTQGEDHGELRILEQGPNRCEIDISVHTERADIDQVQEELAQAVAAFTHKASAEADTRAAEPQRRDG
jgi:hypothetical protein